MYILESMILYKYFQFQSNLTYCIVSSPISYLCSYTVRTLVLSVIYLKQFQNYIVHTTTIKKLRERGGKKNNLQKIFRIVCVFFSLPCLRDNRKYTYKYWSLHLQPLFLAQSCRNPCKFPGDTSTRNIFCSNWVGFEMVPGL